MCHSIKLFFIFQSLWLLALFIGCAGCRSNKKGIENQSKNTDFGISKTNNEINSIEFPSDFPRMNPMPDYLPKGEVYVTNEVSTVYLFDLEGKFVKKISYQDYEKENKARIEFFLKYEKDLVGGVFITDNNREEIYKKLKDFGFEIDREIFNKSKTLRGSGQISISAPTSYGKKILGYYEHSQIDLFDSNECRLGPFTNVNIFNFKGQNFKKLTQKDVGTTFHLSSDLNKVFSTYETCECGHDEPRCLLKFHRFKDLKTSYYIDFNLAEDLSQNFSGETIVDPYQVNFEEDILQFYYHNGSDITRVVVEPYNRWIFFKEYNVKTDFNIDYPSKFYDFLAKYSRPSHFPEDYKTYSTKTN